MRKEFILYLQNRMLATLLIAVIFCVFILVVYKFFIPKEHFSTFTYDSVVLDEIVEDMNKNNNVMEQQNSYVKHFANNYYNTDEIDTLMARERSDMKYVESKVNVSLDKYRDQFPKLVSKETVENQFTSKGEFEKLVFPYVKQKDVTSQLEKHRSDMDSMFYTKGNADAFFLPRSYIDGFNTTVDGVRSTIDNKVMEIKRIGESLDNYETKDNVNSGFVQLADFDKVKDAVDVYKKDVNNIQDLIDDSQIIYEATSKTIANRFRTFYKDLDNVKQQQEYIKSFLKDENNKINGEQIFTFKKDFDILSGEVKLIDKRAIDVDNRVDSVENKLIEMAKKICVGEECLQFTDVKDLKQMVNLFRSSYEQEKELLKDIEADMNGYQKEIMALKETLTLETNINANMGIMHNADMKKLRDEMMETKRIQSEGYTQMIQRIQESNKLYKAELDAFKSKSNNIIDTRNEEVNQMSDIIVDLETQLAFLEKEKATITSRLEELISAYEDENGGYNKRMREKSSTIAYLQDRLDKASSYISENQILINNNVKELSDATAKLQECSSTLNDTLMKNSNLTSDVTRISTLLETAQSGSDVLQEQLRTCNSTLLDRVTKDVYNDIKTQLYDCKVERDNEYIPRFEFENQYMLKDEHNRLLKSCENDINSNYMSKTLVDNEYVTKAKHSLLLAELENPTKYMKNQDVMSNYKSKAEYQQLLDDFTTNCIDVQLLDDEREKVRSCENDMRANYTQNVAIDNAYIAKTTCNEKLDTEIKKCERGKIMDYVHKSRYDTVVADFNKCEKEKLEKYIVKEEYIAVKGELNACADDKKSNYLPKSHVNTLYITNLDHTRVVDKLREEYSNALKNGYLSNNYVNNNYISKTNHQNLLDQQIRACVSEKNTILQTIKFP